MKLRIRPFSDSGPSGLGALTLVALFVCGLVMAQLQQSGGRRISRDGECRNQPQHVGTGA